MNTLAYKGLLFDSRLALKWAVFFDAMDITYFYKPELWTGSVACPCDFFLPQVGMSAIVTQANPALSLQKWGDLMQDETNMPVLWLVGRPANKAYWATNRVDYYLCNPRPYHLTEGRFFSGTGYGDESTYPTPVNMHRNGVTPELIGVRAARVAGSKGE